MYLVVRKDARFTRSQAMALAGEAAVRCRARFVSDPRWSAAFEAWTPRPRKVALRASAEELAAVAELDGVGDDVVRCLPPRLRSQSEPQLTRLRPFTDAPRPSEVPASEAALDPPLLYFVRPGVLRTDGKAMAQAGHAAVRWAERDAAAADAWLERGAPGAVIEADADTWSRLRERADAVIVEDAGLTQVAPGTETVIALPPGAEPPGGAWERPQRGKQSA